MDDRAYFSDWGSCTCEDPDEWDLCPLAEDHMSDESDDEEN